MANEIRDAFNAVYPNGPASAPDQPMKSAVRGVVGATIQSQFDILKGLVFEADEIYVDTATGLAATAEGFDFKVESSDTTIAYIIYRKVSGVAEFIGDVPSASALINAAQTGKTIAVNGNLENSGAGTAWATATPAFALLSDAYLNALGCDYAVSLATLGSEQGSFFKVSPDFPFGNGDWAAVSVFIIADDWDWIAELGVPAIDLRAYDESASAQQLALVDYDSIDANTRRYYGRLKISTLALAGDYLTVGVVAAAGRTATVKVTGYALCVSQGNLSGVDPYDFDPYRTSEFASRITQNETDVDQAQSDAEGARMTVKSVVVNGNLANAGAGLTWILGTSAAIISTADVTLNEIGCNYVASVSSIKYLRIDVNGAYLPGDYIAASVLVESVDFGAAMAADSVRLWMIGKAGGSAQTTLTISSYDQVSESIRRYYAIFQVPEIVGQIDYCFIGIKANVTTGFTGFALGLTKTESGAVDWADFDPYNVRALEARVTSLENGVPTDSPDLIIPKDIFVIQSRSLDLISDQILSGREASSFDIAITGQASNRPSLVDGSVLSIDGSRMTGTCAIWIKRPTTDDTVIWHKEINIHSAPSTAVASPKILVIGDSLTWQGTLDELDAKLQSAGVTPTYIGTYAETSGIAAEARSAWHAKTYTAKRWPVNINGSGMTYPIRTGAGSGAVLTPVLSGGSTGSIISFIINDGGTGHDDNPQLPIVITGGGPDSRCIAYAEVSGGSVVSTTVVSDTTAFTAVPSASLPPTWTEYLALSQNPAFAQRWKYNPFIRPATGGDPAGSVFNGYIFDFDFYLTRSGFSDPSIVQIALGTNDINNMPATATTDVIEAFGIIIPSIKAAVPTAKIGITLNGYPAVSQWEKMVDLIKAILDEYDNRVAEDIYLIPWYATVPAKFGYGFNQSAIDAQTGLETGTFSDQTHPVQIGRSMAAEATFGWMINII